MTPSADPIQAALRAVAAWGLPGAPDIVLPTVTQARDTKTTDRKTTDPRAGDHEAGHPQLIAGFADMAQQTRLIGPLLAASASGDVVLSAELEADLLERQHRALLWCIHLETRLLEAREWFDAAGGIEHLVIKGPSIAYLDTPNPSIRTFADIDLLISGSDLDRAVQILDEHGASPPWAQRRPGFDRRFAKSTTRTFADGVEFDVHRTLASGAHGHRIPVASLFQAPDRFDIGGVAFAALKPTHRLLHSAYHLLLGSPEPALMNLRDLGCYLADTQLGPDRVVPEAQRWRGTAVLAMAIDLVVDRLGVQPTEWSAWRQTYHLDPHEVALIERHRHEGSSFGRAKLDVVRELPRARDRAAYLYALAWPSKAHLASRSLRRRDALGSLVRVALPARRRSP